MSKVILVVDDEEEIRNAIRIYLEREDYHVLEASNGLEAVEMIENKQIHLAIIDIMMPILDGVEATKKIRKTSNLPILMLSAKSDDIDKIQGLQIGADDYLTKPFSPMELMARVKSLLRRYLTLGEYEGNSSLENNHKLTVRGLELDNRTKQVKVEGRAVRLTKTEFKITELLMANPGKVYSIDEIYEAVWEEPSFNSDNTVSVHIRKIREKIEKNPKEPEYLKVVWGVGYKIEK